LLLIGLAQPARADFIYSYTGNSFSYRGTGPDVTNVSGYLDVTYSLAANTTYDLTPNTVGGVLNYDFTDGRTTWNLANYDSSIPSPETISSAFSVTTDANGQIASWNLNIYSSSGAITTCDGSACEAYYSTTNSALDDTNVFFNYDAYNFNSPGTWTETSVPEPATLTMFGLSMAGLGLVRRRKGKSSAVRDD